MTNAVDGIITQVRKEDIDKNGDYIGPMSTKEANGMDDVPLAESSQNMPSLDPSSVARSQESLGSAGRTSCTHYQSGHVVFH
ncbi:hypothetical protein RB195_006511 [Necator americanus]|uniref:Uncharacterized protein n=1 Tax=Necator americanus TaxID=51031 RepID=A0ABR1BWR5_NECAM